MTSFFSTPSKKKSPQAKPEASETTNVASALGQIKIKDEDDAQRSIDFRGMVSDEDRARPEEELDSDDDEALTDTALSDADSDVEGKTERDHLSRISSI